MPTTQEAISLSHEIEANTHSFAPVPIVEEAFAITEELLQQHGQQVAVSIEYATQSYFTRTTCNENRPIGAFMPLPNESVCQTALVSQYEAGRRV